MSSIREQVLSAVQGLIKAALPNADVARNPSKPRRSGAGGVVNMFDGNPGEPTVDLSPTTYNYQHEIPVEVFGFSAIDLTDGEIIELLTKPVGDAVAFDRSLGGLCSYVMVTAPVTESDGPEGTEPQPWAGFSIIAHYATQTPLG